MDETNGDCASSTCLRRWEESSICLQFLECEKAKSCFSITCGSSRARTKKKVDSVQTTKSMSPLSTWKH